LASVPKYSLALAQVAAYPPQLIVPFVETRYGEKHLCIPDGMGYPVTSQRLDWAMRG